MTRTRIYPLTSVVGGKTAFETSIHAYRRSSQTTYPALRYRSPQADLRYAAEQRRIAALRCGLMRTVSYPIEIETFGLFTSWSEKKTFYRSIKIPIMALLIPNHCHRLEGEIYDYCKACIRIEVIPWTNDNQNVVLVVCRNYGDQMTLKIVFPDLC